MPLCGGLESISVAVLLYSMCILLYKMRHTSNVCQYFAKRLKLPAKDVGQQLTSHERMCSILLKSRYNIDSVLQQEDRGASLSLGLVDRC